MMNKKWIMSGLLLAALGLAGVAVAAPAAYNIERWVLGSGGGSDAAGSLALSGTLGQAVTGVDSSGNEGLCAGFWCRPGAIPVIECSIYVPIVVRDYSP